MAATFNISTFSLLSEADQEAAVKSVARIAIAPRNGQAIEIDRRIEAYESSYGISSTVMVARLGSGELREDADVAKWLMLVRVRQTSAR